RPLYRRTAQRSGFRQHRLERFDPVRDGGGPGQSESGAPVRAIQPGRVSAAAPGDQGVQRAWQTGDAVRRDGRATTLLAAALWHGVAQPEHESGVCAIDQRGNPLHDRGERPRGCSARAENENNWRSPRLLNAQDSPDVPERVDARHAALANSLIPAPTPPPSGGIICNGRNHLQMAGIICKWPESFANGRNQRAETGIIRHAKPVATNSVTRV